MSSLFFSCQSSTIRAYFKNDLPTRTHNAIRKRRRKEQTSGDDVQQHSPFLRHAQPPSFIRHRLPLAEKAIRQLVPYKPKKILDIATGTGDFAIMSAKKLHPESVVGIDISEGMMRIGSEKVKATGLDDVISFMKEDCEHMSFADNTFDALTAAFGIRNFQNLDACLKEMCRVLKKAVN